MVGLVCVCMCVSMFPLIFVFFRMGVCVCVCDLSAYLKYLTAFCVSGSDASLGP